MSEDAKRAIISYERKPQTIHSFFALKFHDGDEDLAKVNAIEAALNKAGITITLMARDVEKWGEATIPEGKALMRDYAFPAMKQCDCNIIEFSEKGVGLGMNGGYCYAAGKPIFVIAKTGSDISTTMSNVAEEKSLQLANRIVNLYNYLVNEKKDYVLSRQILRPGTSIGANIAEAQDAQSRKDFVSKMSIALKETSETKYWLKVLLNGTYISKQEFDSLFDDVCEMHKIISSIVLTTKEN